MYKFFVIFFTAIIFNISYSIEHFVYYEKKGEIYEYSVEKNFLRKIIGIKDKHLWNFKISDDGNYFIVVVEDIGKEIPTANLELYSMVNRKKLLSLGENNKFNYNGNFFYDKIVYVSENSENSDIFVYEIKNGKIIKISNPNKKSIYPVIDKVNNKILFQEYNFNKNKWEIYSYNILKNKLEILNISNILEIQYPSISIDGQKIAFEETEIEKSFIGIYDIFTKQYKRITFSGNEKFPVFINKDTIIFVKDGKLFKKNINSKIEEFVLGYPDKIIISNPKYLDNYIIYDMIKNDEVYVGIYSLNTRFNKIIDLGKNSFIYCK